MEQRKLVGLITRRSLVRIQPPLPAAGIGSKYDAGFYFLRLPVDLLPERSWVKIAGALLFLSSDQHAGPMPCLPSSGSAMTLNDDVTESVLNDLRSVLKQAGIVSGTRILLACSGGQDSSALLHAMNQVALEVGTQLTVAHFNHMLRNGESDSDENYVRCQAAKLDLQIVVGRPSSPLIGDEASARDARLQFLAETAVERQIGWVATGHTLTDQVETILLRLARGTGLRGVGGMSVVNAFPLDRYRDRLRTIRPFLRCPREATERYCKVNRWSYVVDRTNLTDDYARTRIRRKVLPVLAGLNSDALSAIGRFADIAREQDRFVECVARDWLDQYATKCEGLTSLPLRELDSVDRGLQRAVIRLAIEGVRGDLKDLNLTDVDRVLAIVAGENASSANLSGGIRAIRLYERLWFEPAGWQPSKLPEIEVNVPGQAMLSETKGTLFANPVPQPCGLPNDLSRHVDIPLDRSAPLVTVRGRVPGDRIKLKGVGTKKVQDVLVDAKVPRPLRDLTPMILTGRRLVWIVGHGADLSSTGEHWLCLRIEPW